MEDKKFQQYERVYNQLVELLKNDNDIIAKMATINALLFHKIKTIFWCGFYRIINEQLMVGPYQGPLACQILTKNKGVCWAAINQQKSIIVPDVHKFPEHIACDSRSNSEIVVPFFINNIIAGVLDIDSKEFAAFDETDQLWLEKIIQLLPN